MARPKKLFKKVNHPLTSVYRSMRDRCYNQNRPNFKYYGGRGITVCDEWLENPDVFFLWAEANGWKKGLEIDRIDNDGPYAPENCRWVTHKANMSNTRSVVKYTVQGITGSMSNLIEQFCPTLTIHAVRSRIKDGWGVEEAFTTPPNPPPKTARHLKIETIFGVSAPRAELIRLFSTVGDNTVCRRLQTGWTLEGAILTPAHGEKC